MNKIALTTSDTRGIGLSSTESLTGDYDSALSGRRETVVSTNGSEHCVPKARLTMATKPWAVQLETRPSIVDTDTTNGAEEDIPTASLGRASCRRIDGNSPRT